MAPHVGVVRAAVRAAEFAVAFVAVNTITATTRTLAADAPMMAVFRMFPPGPKVVPASSSASAGQ
jgi:hypothetical protein